MSNDAEAYIEAVAEASAAAGLIVADYGTDDIDPRDGLVHLMTKPEAEGDEEDWEISRTLAWDEQRGWMYGEPRDHHGELTNIIWLGDGPLPEPSDIAELARKAVKEEFTREEYRRLIGWVRWRDQEDDDGFDEQLAAYRDKAAAVPPQEPGTGDDRR